MIVTLLFPGVANATRVVEDCDGAHAPSIYYNESCGAICQFINGNTIECDLDGLEGAGAQVYAVESWDVNTAHTYSVFGHIDNADFCCFVDDSAGSEEVTFVLLQGTSFTDYLSFNLSGRDVTNAVALAFGYGGGDFLIGSNESAVTTSDQLYGGAGADNISSLNGDGDYLNGCDGLDGCLNGDDDEIDGGEGVDFIFGDGGDDELDGGPAGDLLYGGPGQDHLQGGDGEDVLQGATGDDTLEGGAEADELYGEGGNDDLTGRGGADLLYGGNGDDVLCTGTGTGDSLNGGPAPHEQVSPTGTNDDQLWPTTGAVGPSGTVVGANSNCGNNGFGTSWAGAACGSAACCTYGITLPTFCSN